MSLFLFGLTIQFLQFAFCCITSALCLGVTQNHSGMIQTALARYTAYL